MSCAELYEQMLEEEGYHDEHDKIETSDKNENITITGEKADSFILDIRTCSSCAHSQVCGVKTEYEKKFSQIQKAIKDVCMNDEIASSIQIDIKCKKYMPPNSYFGGYHLL